MPDEVVRIRLRDGICPPVDEVSEAMRQAGYVVVKDDGLYCVECGLPDPDGYTADELGGRANPMDRLRRG